MKKKSVETVLPYAKEVKTDADLLIMCMKDELMRRNKKIEHFKEKFEEDYLYAFKWYGEEMCIQNIWVTQLTWILQKIQVQAYSKSEIFAYYINLYENYLKSQYNVRSSSTSALDRELSVFTYQTYIELLSYMNNLKKSYPEAF
jgi:hypothetical protein